MLRRISRLLLAAAIAAGALVVVACTGSGAAENSTYPGAGG